MVGNLGMEALSRKPRIRVLDSKIQSLPGTQPSPLPGLSDRTVDGSGTAQADQHDGRATDAFWADDPVCRLLWPIEFFSSHIFSGPGGVDIRDVNGTDDAALSIKTKRVRYSSVRANP
jgi:hypothetical protein